MKLIQKGIFVSVAALLLTAASIAAEYVCQASNGQTCTAKNLATGKEETFKRGEKIVIPDDSSDTWKLSENFDRKP